MRMREQNPIKPFDTNLRQLVPPVTIARVNHQCRVAIDDDVGTTGSSNLKNIIDNAVDSIGHDSSSQDPRNRQRLASAAGYT